MKPRGITLYLDQLRVLESLTDAEAGALFKAIASYAEGDDESLARYTSERIVALMFSQFKCTIDAGFAKYDRICERNKANRNASNPVATASRETLPTPTTGDDSSRHEPIQYNTIHNNTLQYNTKQNNMYVYSADARTHTHSFFFFMNLNDPQSEVDRFYANHENNQWKTPRGVVIETERMLTNALKNWDVKPTTKRGRFSPEFLSFWRTVYDLLPTGQLKSEALSESISVDETDASVIILCPTVVSAWIDDNIPSLKKSFDKNYHGRKLYFKRH